MNVEELIGRTLQDKASAVVPPVPDTAAIRRRAVHEQNRIVGVLAAAAIAAVVVVSVVLGGREPQDTGPVDPPNQSQKLEGPVWGDHEGLHAGTTVFRLDETSAAVGVVEDALLVQRIVGSPSDEEPPEVQLVRPGQKPQVIGRSEAGPMGDPGGSLAAWFDDEDLVVVDTSTGVERLRLEVGPNRGSVLGLGARVPILYLDDRQVIYAAATAVWRVALDDPASVPKRLGGPGLLDAAPHVEVVAERSSVNEWSLPRRPTRLDIRIDGRSVGTFGPTLAEASLSPDARYVATATDYDRGHRLVVLDSTNARPVPLSVPDLPVLATGYPWGWVGDHTLVAGLMTDDTSSARAVIVQCDVAAARCERVSTTVQPALPY